MVAKGKRSLLWIIKTFSTWWFWRLSSSFRVGCAQLSWVQTEVSPYCPWQKNNKAHLEYTFIHRVTGCFAPINQVLSVRGKTCRRYKVDTCRVFPPGTCPTQCTGARLLLFTLPWCHHGGHTRLYQVTVNQRGDSKSSPLWFHPCLRKKCSSFPSLTCSHWTLSPLVMEKVQRLHLRGKQ